MSEQLQSSLAASPDLATHNVLHEQYAVEFSAGLERAQAAGFDLHQSLVAEGQRVNESLPPAERAERIKTTAGNIAGELRLEPGFYDSPANTILLAGIADMWVENEQKLATTEGHDAKLAAERDMLVDASMVLAGKYSQAAKEIGSVRPDLQDRYVEAVATPEQLERKEFLDSINDTELASKVEAILQQSGPGSLLEKQREALGLTSDTETAFNVKVMKFSNRWDLERSGAIEPVNWPTYDEAASGGQSAEWHEESRLALEQADRNSAFAAPFYDNEKKYYEKFSETFGVLPPAFVDSRDGTMYLRAAEAFALVNLFDGDKPVADQGEFERSLAFIQHEYGHTQKKLLIGAHIQMGLILEERKAELISGDRHGYNDVKDFMLDLSMASDQDLITTLAESLQQEDALTTYLSAASSKVGLKNTLMMMLAKPLPYENNPDQAEKFTDITSMVVPEDVSTLDAIVRQDLEQRGDESIRKRAAAWAGKRELDPENIDFFRGFYFPYREHHGSGQGTKYLKEAVENRIKAENLE